MHAPKMRILILGGTTEASALARALVHDERFATTISLAGRTRAPAATSGLTQRIGGFGGIDGLAHWLADEKISAVIDATHPYAAQISRNADAACTRLNLPLCTIVRPPWQSISGDRWRNVPATDTAADAIGEKPQRVFLSIGKQGVGAFRNAPQHSYIIRTIEPPKDEVLPPNTTLIRARGPFALEDEIELLTSQSIDVLVSKNAGGRATYAKIDAARHLGLPVIMIERPYKAGRHIVATADDALAWLSDRHGKSLSDRGV